MLLHHIMQHYPQKLQIVQKEQVLSHQVIPYEDTYHLIHNFIIHNRFVAAELALNRQDKKLMHLLQFATRLTYGESAFTNVNATDYYFKVLKEVLIEDVQAPNDKIQFVDTMQGLLYEKQMPFIYFLQSYAALLYEDSDMSDFVLMYYRLAEELLLYAMGWDVNKSGHFIIRKGATSSLTLPSRILSKHFNSYLNYIKQSDSFYALQLLEQFDQPWLQEVIQLRHDGISGHGFKAYRQRDIEDICGGHPLEKITPLLQHYNVHAPYDFFTIIKEAMAARARLIVTT